MIAAHRLKSELVSYLKSITQEVNVFDSMDTTPVELPAISVSVRNVAEHSPALANIMRVDVEVMLRCHVGDESQHDELAGSVESALASRGPIVSLSNDWIRIYDWIYSGALPEFNDGAIDTVFSGSAICRVEPGPPNFR